MIEVFNKISERMVNALMFHEQMADYFDFLDLHGLKRWHEKQFFNESCSYRKTHRYVINHLHKIPNDSKSISIQVIPNSWYNATQFDVDNSTRKQAVKDAFSKWYDWEKETKSMYEQMFKQLTDNSKIAEANYVNCLIKDVDCELKLVCRKMLEYKSVDYDMQYIMYQQPELHEKYKLEEKGIGFDIS